MCTLKKISSNALKLFPIFLFFLASSAFAYTPNEFASGIGANSCWYKITGTKADGGNYDTGWKSTPCANTNLDFEQLGVPDGTFNLYIAAVDNTVSGDTKYFNYPGSTSSSKVPTSADYANKLGINAHNTTNIQFKLDTSTPTCHLDEVNLKAGKTNNSYFNGGNFYYKSSAGAGDYSIKMTSVDGGANKSGVKSILFDNMISPEANKKDYPFNGNTLVTATHDFAWSGNNGFNENIIGNVNAIKCSDLAGNFAPAVSDSSTKVIYSDTGDVISNPGSITFVPDGTNPTFNQMTDLLFKSGNFGTGPNEPLLANATTSKYLAALDNRKLVFDNLQDGGSGVKKFSLSMERADNPNNVTNHDLGGSTPLNKVSNLSSANDVNFSDVSQKGDMNEAGFRKYSWSAYTTNLDGTKADDKLCDNVGNCVPFNTPDIPIVANAPSNDPGSATSLSDSSSSIISANLSDAHTFIVRWKDKFGNDVLPVSGVKELKTDISFTNTLGTDQTDASTANSGDGVDFLFSYGLGSLVESSSGKKSFSFIKTQANQYPYGTLKAEMRSAVPTKNEYIDIGKGNVSIYGDNTAELKLNNLSLAVTAKNSYTSVGDGGLTPATNFNYRFSPAITFNKMDNIYPLINGVEKKVNLTRGGSDPAKVNSFQLGFAFNDTNPFVQFKNIHFDSDAGTSSGYHYLGNGNAAWPNMGWQQLSALTANEPRAKTNLSSHLLTNGADVYRFTADTLGGITDAGDNKVGVTSLLRYNIGSKYVQLPSLQSGYSSYARSNKAIVNPAVYTPDLSDSTIIFAEIAVSGISQTRNSGITNGAGGTTTASSSTKFQDFSTISLYDIKTNINQNVEDLLKGKNRQDGYAGAPTATLESFDFSSSAKGIKLQGGNVIYFKDTEVILNCLGTCTISGKKTIIVENGNLRINSNMKYANSDSILGIILIGNKDGTKSKLRISDKITNGVGIVYSEGPVVSFDSDSLDDYYTDKAINETSLLNQLYWIGSFATRNTVGGSIKNELGECPYGTAHYKNGCTQEISKSYDLIFLRRYGVVGKDYYPTISAQGPFSAVNKLPYGIDLSDIYISGNRKVVRNSGTVQDIDASLPKSSNISSPFIINYDSNLQKNPPIGFNLN